MDRNLQPAALPEPTHVPAAERLRDDILALRERAHRHGCPATAQALDLAMEMLSVELAPEDEPILLHGALRS